MDTIWIEGGTRFGLVVAKCYRTLTTHYKDKSANKGSPAIHPYEDLFL